MLGKIQHCCNGNLMEMVVGSMLEDSASNGQKRDGPSTLIRIPMRTLLSELIESKETVGNQELFIIISICIESIILYFFQISNSRCHILLGRCLHYFLQFKVRLKSFNWYSKVSQFYQLISHFPFLFFEYFCPKIAQYRQSRTSIFSFSVNFNFFVFYLEQRAAVLSAAWNSKSILFGKF